MATINDIARKAMVSTATVSRYLNSSGYVSAETGKLIEKACCELNYSVKKYKRRDKGEDNANVIGVIVSEYNNTFFADAINAIEKTAEAHGKEILICDSRERADVEMRNIGSMLSRAGGMIIVPVSQTTSNNASYLKEINDTKMPVVLFDRDFTDVHLDGVLVDSYSGAFDAVSSLLSAGHKNIAMLSGPAASKPGLERLNGYINALKAYDIPIRDEFILYADFEKDKAYRLTKKLLSQKNNNGITAFFAANISMGLGCLKAIDESGLRIPEDIGFITFDDYPTFELSRCNFSVVQNPGYHAGEEAAQLLISRMNETRKSRRSSTKRVVLSPGLVLRGSERYFRQDDDADEDT